MSGANAHDDEFKTIIEWSCGFGFDDVKDAVTAEMWRFLALTVLIKNMASSWTTFGLDNIPDILIAVVTSDSNFG